MKVCDTDNVIHANQWCNYMDLVDYEDVMTVISATFEGCAKACQDFITVLIKKGIRMLPSGSRISQACLFQPPPLIIRSPGHSIDHSIHWPSPSTAPVESNSQIIQSSLSWQALAHPSKVALITVIISS